MEFICIAIFSAYLGSVETNKSTDLLPESIRPVAFIRGPILKTMSFIWISLSSNPVMSIIDFKPSQGLVFNCCSP